MKKYFSILMLTSLLTGSTSYSQILTNQKYNQANNNLGFIENKGQIIDQDNKLNPDVKYLLNMSGLNVQLKANSFSYDAYTVERHPKKQDEPQGLPLPGLPVEEDITLIFHRIDIEFIGANNTPQIIAEQPGSDYLNYYTTATPEEGITRVKHYGKVTYTDLYPGIDLVFYARPGSAKPVEFNFIIHPDADLSQIKWKYSGSNDVKLADGKIQIQTAHGLLSESIPMSFEKESGINVDMNYQMTSGGIFSFGGVIDPLKTIVIDPIPNLIWATYYGGSGNDQAWGVSYDPAGNIYVTGESTSSTNIATSGTHQTTYAGGTVQYALGGDAFIIKLSSTGGRLWGTYFGGSGEDLGYSIKTNSSGESYVSGNTNSSSGIATTGAFQTTFAGSYHDAFLAKFSTAGIRLWGTYFGGTGNDRATYNGMAMDASGYVYITGTNNTANNSWITTAGAYKSTNGSTSAYDDPYVAKFSPSGSLVWGTYYGGSDHDQCYAIALDASNNVYIGGNCVSTTGIATAGSHQATHGGGSYEGFLAKLNSTGTALLWATYYGSTGSDLVTGIAVDANDNVFISGYTSSTAAIATTGAYQTTNAGGSYDGFLAKFNSSGVRQWGTYYGGSDIEALYGLNVNSNGDILMSGYTASASGIATSGTYQTTNAGGGGTRDGFLAKFSTTGSRLWGTYFGGALEDIIWSKTLDPGGNIFMAGRTLSTTGIATTGAFQTSNGGGTMDGFVSKFQDKQLTNDAGISLINTPAGVITPGTTSVTATIKNYGNDTLRYAGLRWSVNGSNQTAPSNWSGALAKDATYGPVTIGSYTFGTGYYTIKVWTTAPNGISDSNAFNDTATITILSCGPASGTYVIDPAGTGDFKSFNLALNWIKNCGVSAPVTFRVKPGTYSEQLTIPAISGASATNRITFESYNLDSSGVTLAYAATGTADNWVVRFNGCSYVTFRKMTISATGASYGYVVEYINGASYDNLENNILLTTITTTSAFAGVYSTTTADQYNTIKNNVISGGYYGIYWYGISTTSFELGNVIEGNTIRDYYYYGILAYYQNAIKIRKNTVTTTSASTTLYGIFTYYCQNNIELTQNNVQLTATGTIYPFTLSSDLGTTALRGNVSNNFISTMGTTASTIYGLYVSSSSYHDVSFNSVSISNTLTTGRAFFITAGTASTVNVYNNNFANLGGGYAIYTGTATTALGTCNYNNLYTTGASLGYWTANIANLAAWRTASSKDANSVSVNPNYFTGSDLHINSPTLSNAGTYISAITTDIDGDSRLNPPDIGADEFTLVANDAGVSGLTAPIPPCPGSNIVTAKLKNYGTATLTSAVINWTVNGVTQSPFTASVALSQNQEATLDIGSYSFSIGTTYNIKLWTTQPNGVSDGNARNDTFSYKNLTTRLGGTYTIGGASSNYPTIGAAVAVLQAKGICTATTFKIKKGTYSEKVVIPAITGASAVNRITFDGGSVDSVKITYAGTSTTVLATVLLNGADYITFKNVTIQNTGTTYGIGVCLAAQADYNILDSCLVICDTVGTSSTVIAIQSNNIESSSATTGNSANYTTISNCTVKGGYYGIRLYGTSYTVQCTNNSIINCKISKVYQYGVYSYYQTFPTYRNNTLFSFRTTSPYGIMNYYSISTPTYINNNITGMYYGIYNYGYSSAPCTNPQIFGNTIRASYIGLYNYYNTSSNIEQNDIVGGYYGLYCYYETNPVDSSTIINNLIRKGGNTSYPYGFGLYIYYSARVGVYHNTIQTDSSYTTTTSYGTVYMRSNSGPIKFKNNIFNSIGNLPCFNTDGTNLAAGDLDYNIYYTGTTGNIIAYWGTNSITSYTVWRSSMPTYNKNSLYADPQLISKYNLHLRSGATFYGGASLGITTDFDNDYRCLPMPTIGADEFIHPYSKPNADFLADTTACISSPYTFLNKARINEPKRHFWFVNSVFKSNAVNFTYQFQNTGINSVTLITQNCSTTDTITKFLNVKTPTSAPLSYFVVNKNKIEVNEVITFTDLSSSCPEHWKWTITPDSFFDPLVGKNVCTYLMSPGADTTQSPQISFVYSGFYSICLSTSNSINIGTTYCMNNYIEVIPAVKLCFTPFETKEFSGTIYDDGGNVGQYGPNKNCGLLIHPCSKSVSLIFTQFDLVAGDFIRIYDGVNNQATPLWNPILYPNGMNNNNRPPTSTDTFTAKSGSLYLEISTDGATAGNGIIAKWFSTPDTYPPTVASFQISDTICNGVQIVYSNTSTGTQNDYFWDYENDGVTDASTFNGITKYMQDGYYDVKLTAKGCGGTDSFIKKVYVNTPMATPKFELLASNTKPNAYYELVTLTLNTLQNCVDTTIWDITPKTYTLVSGKLGSNSSVTLKFDDTVCYDITLIGKYHGFSDTMVYPCFIKPLVYCRPFAANISKDVGISRVRINTIDNLSDIGVTDYTDYSNTVSTDLEKGATYAITLDRITNSNPMNRKVWIDYNRDGNFDNSTELVAFENSDYTLSWTGTIMLPRILDLGITRLRIGTSLGTSPNLPCGPNIYGEYEDYRLNIIADRTKPVMTLIGPNIIHIQECTGGFIDPGVAVTDNVDSNLADSVKITGVVDPYKSGSYIIYYNVKDAAGNMANTLSRTVVVDKEPIPPQITLKGNTTEIIQIFSSYTDAGYDAIDTCSGLDKVVATNGVDTANIGTYYYSYRAYDNNGNYADISRTVYVKDTVDPVITSISDDTINLNIYNILPRPLYTVTDNYYSSFSIKITVKGNYYQKFPNGEATIPGYYTFMYVATDGSGNSDSINFIIHVQDKVKPVLQLLGEPYYFICRYETLTDPGYTVTDNYDPNPQVVKSGSYIDNYLVKKGKGKYELIYTATDNSGNMSVASRFVFVSDTGSCFNSIAQQEINNPVVLYPNPGNGKLNLEFNLKSEEKVNISVINSVGETIARFDEVIKPGMVKSLNYHYLKSGIYFIQVTLGNKITTLKYNLMK